MAEEPGVESLTTEDDMLSSIATEIRQENDGSGESTNNNCALNSIDSAAATVACPVTSGLPDRLPPSAP